MRNIDSVVKKWKESLTSGPGGEIPIDELDDFVGASVGSCSHCTCSQCPACTSGCGCTS